MHAKHCIEVEMGRKLACRGMKPLKQHEMWEDESSVDVISFFLFWIRWEIVESCVMKQLSKNTQMQTYSANLCVEGSPLCSRCWNWTADVCEAAAAELDSSHMSLALWGAAQQPARWHQHERLAAKNTQTQLWIQTETCLDLITHTHTGNTE